MAAGLLTGVFGVYAPQAGASHPGTSGNGVTPTYVAGNPKCPGDSELLRIDGVPEDDEYDAGDGTITISNSTNTSFDWDADGVTIGTVIVKAGNGGFVYTYDTAATSDTNMQSPHSKHNDPNQPQAAISHVSFCVGSAALDTGILRVEKSVTDEVDDDFDADDLEFVFDVECTLEGEEPITFEGETVTPSTPWESPQIPTGYSCEVTEDESQMPDADGADWGTPTYDGNPATIGDGDPVTVEIQNVREEEEDEPRNPGGPIITDDTTTTTTTTTTTVPDEVLGEEVTTTTAAPAEETTTTEAVAGIQLPRTGVETGTLLVLAGIALVLGGLLVSASDAAARRLGRERA